MNMPGFTGEASLYKTGRHYYKAGKLTQTDGVYPRLPYLISCPSTTVSCGGVKPRWLAVENARRVAAGNAFIETHGAIIAA